MTRPAASVVVCVHNRPLQVVRCLESLAASELADLEVVVVDDGSTDGTPRAVEAFRDAHPGLALRVVRHAVNRGVSAARNSGLDAARGAIVAFTDSDCVVEPGWIGALAAALGGSRSAAAADPELDSTGRTKGGATADPVGGLRGGPGEDPRRASDPVAASGEVIDAPPRTWAERAFAGSARVGRGLFQRTPLVGGNMAFRAELLERYRFDPALTYGCDEDDLAWRLGSDGGRIVFVPEARVVHEHRLGLGAYLRLAWRQGRGAARFWRKRGILLGRDLIALAVAAVTAPLALLDPRLAAVPAAALALQLAALAYAEVALKGKPPLTALAVLPLQLVASVVKLAAVAVTRTRLAVGRDPTPD